MVKEVKLFKGCTQPCWLVGPISPCACCSYACVSHPQRKSLPMWCKSEEPRYESYLPIISSAVNVLWSTCWIIMSFAIVVFPVCSRWHKLCKCCDLVFGLRVSSSFHDELNPWEDKLGQIAFLEFLIFYVRVSKIEL